VLGRVNPRREWDTTYLAAIAGKRGAADIMVLLFAPRIHNSKRARDVS